MKTRELSIPHAFEFTPTVHRDARGSFTEWYQFEAVEEAVGHPLNLKQGNASVSQEGVARGIHYALVPPSQAKYVTVTHGAVLDYIVDIRVGSPTFGQWESVLLDDESHRAVYLAEGLGHAFVTLTDGATVSYLVSEVFNPTRELAINLQDPDVGLQFPVDMTELQLSPKDVDGASLADSLAAGSLPTWADCLALYDSLNQQNG